ncbi:hypothetical protein [Leuconostoc citreum]|uniref:hypothetical protein n=1 Tax=Leuconostoc citreum TaxID=33964 RepID=UPI0032DFBCDD
MEKWFYAYNPETMVYEGARRAETQPENTTTKELPLLKGTPIFVPETDSWASINEPPIENWDEYVDPEKTQRADLLKAINKLAVNFAQYKVNTDKRIKELETGGSK